MNDQKDDKVVFDIETTDIPQLEDEVKSIRWCIKDDNGIIAEKKIILRGHKEIRILAVDIETSGSSVFHNEMIALGYCLGDEEGNVEVKKRVSFLPKSGKDDYAFDTNCYENFWSMHKDKLEIFKKEGVNPLIGISTFIRDVDSFDEKYDLRIISDNPSFDIAFINFYLCILLNRSPLSYIQNDTNRYRPVYDTDSYARGVMGLDYKTKWTSDKQLMEKLGIEDPDVEHDHMPENDAEYIYKLHTAAINKLN